MEEFRGILEIVAALLLITYPGVLWCSIKYINEKPKWEREKWRLEEEATALRAEVRRRTPKEERGGIEGVRWFSAHNGRGETVISNVSHEELKHQIALIGRKDLTIRERWDEERDIWEK